MRELIVTRDGELRELIVTRDGELRELIVAERRRVQRAHSTVTERERV